MCNYIWYWAHQCMLIYANLYRCACGRSADSGRGSEEGSLPVLVLKAVPVASTNTRGSSSTSAAATARTPRWHGSNQSPLPLYPSAVYMSHSHSRPPSTHKGLQSFTVGDCTFWLKSFAETFAEPKLTYLDQSLDSAKVSAIRWFLKYLLRPKLSRTNLAKVGSIFMEEIALALRA